MAAADTSIEFTGGELGGELGSPGQPHPGIGPYKLAAIRLRRNKVALAFGAMFLLIVVMCLLAPVYSNQIAHTGPNENHVTDTVKVNGKEKDVVSPGGIPIGPTWQKKFFLGADQNGRDVAVRLLYGGRNSLPPGGGAPPLTMFFSPIPGGAARPLPRAPPPLLHRGFD